MNRKEKINFIKGIVTGEYSPEDLLPPEAIYKHIDGFIYENVDTGERKELLEGISVNGTHPVAAIYKPSLGFYIFTTSLQTCYDLKYLKKGNN